MSFKIEKTFKTALKSSWIILKLIVPIYILADILFYYDVLRHITFIFKPIVSFIGLPQEAALSIVSGLFLNLYAAIAFAAPLGLSPKEWTILALFLGIAHALLVETEIMRRLGIARSYSIILRLLSGLVVAYGVSLLPESYFTLSHEQSPVSTPTLAQYDSIMSLLYHSSYEALSLSTKVIGLVSVLIFILDFIKSLSWIEHYSQKVNSGFSITVGVVLGITYGASILISEYQKGSLSKRNIMFIGTYLMICHAIIEDTLLFVIFGANPWIIVSLRVLFATIISMLIVKFVRD